MHLQHDFSVIMGGGVQDASVMLDLDEILCRCFQGSKQGGVAVETRLTTESGSSRPLDVGSST